MTKGGVRAACERLEPRRLLAGSSPVVDPTWFASIVGPAARRAVVEPQTEWIVQLTAAAATASDSPAAAAAKLRAEVPGIEGVRGLGGRGQLLVMATAGQAAALARLGDVFTVEPNASLFAAGRLSNDPRLLDGSLWGLRNTGIFGGVAGADVDAAEAWSTTVGRDDVVVAVIDGGIDISHPDLSANVWRNPDEVGGNATDDDANGFVNDVSGWNFFGDNPTVYESGDNDHATLVAGIVAATGDNGIGGVGVSWNARIMPLKFIGPGGSGPTSAAIAAVNYATLMRQRGVNLRIINASWGGGPFNAALDTAIRNAGNAGILFVASAGNAGLNDDLSSTPNYPAAYTAANIISVAATDRRDALWSSSNYGLTRVDLGAPGVDIFSTVPGGYGTRSGTSFAAPFVAGAAALALSVDASLSVAALKQAILAGVDPLPALAGKTVSGGRLNAARTVALLAPPPPVNRAPTGLTFAGSVVSAGAPAGTVVGRFSAIDPDADDTFTYELVGGAAAADHAWFTISGDELRTAAPFTGGFPDPLTLRVRVTDAGGLSYPRFDATAPLGFFDNGSFTFPARESANLAASLGRLGQSHTTFSSIDAAAWRAAGASGVIVIPELQSGDLFAALDTAAVAALRDHVAGGGGLLVFDRTTSQPYTLNLLNGVFGFALGGGAVTTAQQLDAAVAAGTAFASGPPDLPDASATEGVATTTLPPGSLSVYRAGSATSVFVAPHGSGAVGFLGFDWYEQPTPAGWETVLGAALRQIRPPGWEVVTVSVTPPTEIIATAPGAEFIDTITRTDGRQLVVRGGGRTVLAAANQHTGGTIVEAGELVIRHVGALGAGALEVRPGARVTVDVGDATGNDATGFVALSALVLDAAGRLELGTSRIRVASGGYDVATIRDRLVAGRNGGSWDGTTGVTSAAARPGSFRAVGYRMVSPGGDVRLGFAAFGDANLDGMVNLTDVQLINGGGRYNQGAPASWEQGDFNYDAIVNLTDVSLLNGAGVYGSGAYPSPLQAAASARVTEGPGGIPAAAWLAYAISHDSKPAAPKRRVW